MVWGTSGGRSQSAAFRLLAYSTSIALSVALAAPSYMTPTALPPAVAPAASAPAPSSSAAHPESAPVVRVSGSEIVGQAAYLDVRPFTVTATDDVVVDAPADPAPADPPAA